MNGLDLMKKLGSGVMPAGLSGTPTTLGRADQGAMFESLLRGAFNTEESSGQTVSVSSAAGVTLSEEQLGRLSKAADKAEAAGAKSALIELDGAFYKLDVASRQITGVAVLNEASPLGSLDTVIRATNGSGAAGGAHGHSQPDANWLLKRLSSML